MQKVFITGIFRSGTTLLSRSLSNHPKIHISYQPLFPLFQVIYRKAIGESFKDNNCPMGDEYVSRVLSHRLKEVLPEIKVSKEEKVILKSLLKDYYYSDQTEKDNFIEQFGQYLSGETLLEIFDSFIQYQSQQTGKEICGIKEVWCSDFIRTLALNDVKCIHISRDPRGVICSRNYGTYLINNQGEKYPILFIARTWRNDVRLYEENKGLKNYFHVRYEDLIDEPKKTLSRISDFIGVEFSESMLDYQNFRVGDIKWEGNVESDKLASIDASRGNRWQDVLTKEDIYLCEFLCGKEMEKLGYELKNKEFSREVFSEIANSQISDDHWLAKYGYVLNKEEQEKEVKRRLQYG